MTDVENEMIKGVREVVKIGVETYMDMETRGMHSWIVYKKGIEPLALILDRFTCVRAVEVWHRVVLCRVNVCRQTSGADGVGASAARPGGPEFQPSALDCRGGTSDRRGRIAGLL
eukprot:5047156-Amphidinium_carterae.1